MALLDADLIVLRPLTPLFEAAAGGRVVVFADPVSHRFDSRWEDLLALPPLRRQPYVNSGLIVLPAEPGRRVLEAMAEGRARVEYPGLRLGGGRPTDPFYYVDQDLWNALLASLLRPDELEILAMRLAPHPPFPGLHRIANGDVRHAYADGSEPYVLHHIGRKPWLAATRANVYTELMARLLLGEDVPVRVDPKRVPRRFRAGPLSALDRLRTEAVAVAHGQRGKLGLRRRLGERLGSRDASS